MIRETGDLLIQTQARIVALEAELAAARKDAERYRWLRNQANISDDEPYAEIPGVLMWGKKEGSEFNERFESFDAAIDAALGKWEAG